MEICEVVFPLLTNCDGSKPLPEIIFQVEAGRQENLMLIEVSLKRHIYIYLLLHIYSDGIKYCLL